jgi:hypothetical protein
MPDSKAPDSDPYYTMRLYSLAMVNKAIREGAHPYDGPSAEDFLKAEQQLQGQEMIDIGKGGKTFTLWCLYSQAFANIDILQRALVGRRIHDKPFCVELLGEKIGPGGPDSTCGIKGPPKEGEANLEPKYCACENPMMTTSIPLPFTTCVTCGLKLPPSKIPLDIAAGDIVEFESGALSKVNVVSGGGIHCRDCNGSKFSVAPSAVVAVYKRTEVKPNG